MLRENKRKIKSMTNKKKGDLELRSRYEIELNQKGNKKGRSILKRCHCVVAPSYAKW